MSKLEEITEQALALEPLERSHLIDYLMASFSSEYLASVEEAWKVEVEARIDAYERGELETISMEESKRRLGLL